jgi:hypothetical protein
MTIIALLRPSLPSDKVCSRENPRPDRGPLSPEPLSLPRPSPSPVRKRTPRQDLAEVRRGHEHSMHIPTSHRVAGEQEQQDLGPIKLQQLR